MPFQLIHTFYHPHDGLQPLKNNLPYKSIEMGFNPFLEENEFNSLGIIINKFIQSVAGK